MSGILDNEPWEHPCPGCGQKIQKTIGWLKTHNEYICTCGHKIELKTDEFRRKIGKIERFFGKS